jgi:glutamate synthase domain-containing protein 3
MSGGIAYVLDPGETFRKRCNTQMVDLEPLDDPEDIQLVRSLIVRHVQYTGSELGSRVLDNFEALRPVFVKVMPKDYKRVLQAQARAAALGREATFLELVGVPSA